MKFFSTICVLSFTLFALQAQAQIVDSYTAAPLLGVPGTSAPVLTGDDTPESVNDLVTQGQFYFDLNLPVAVRQFPMNVGANTVIAYIAQRFTSPSETTYLDSVRVFFPTKAVGDVKLIAFEDTLMEISNGMYFHFANMGASAAIIDTFRFTREEIPSQDNLTAAFTGMPLPAEWHIVFQPEDRGDVYPAFTVAMSMDSVLTSSMTTDYVRVTYLYIYNNTQAGIGVYYENSAEPTYSFVPNLLMTAYIRYETNTGIEEPAAVQELNIDGVYPHPISATRDGGATLAYTSENEENISIAIYDIMGRLVRNVAQMSVSAGSKLVNISTVGLAPGMYSVRVQGARNIATKNILITE